jgi:hypothetical protein
MVKNFLTDPMCSNPLAETRSPISFSEGADHDAKWSTADDGRQKGVKVMREQCPQTGREFECGGLFRRQNI